MSAKPVNHNDSPGQRAGSAIWASGIVCAVAACMTFASVAMAGGAGAGGLAIWALFTVPALAVTLITGIFTAVLGVKAARTPSHTTRVPEHREQPLPHMLRGLLAGTLFAALVLLVLMAVP